MTFDFEDKKYKKEETEVLEVLDEVLAMKMQLENYLEEARVEASQSQRLIKPIQRHIERTQREDAEARTQSMLSTRRIPIDGPEADEEEGTKRIPQMTELKVFDPCIVVMRIVSLRIDPSGAVSLTLKGTYRDASYARVSKLTKPELVVVTLFC